MFSAKLPKTTSKALVPSSDALVSNSFLLRKAPVTTSVALVPSSFQRPASKLEVIMVYHGIPGPSDPPRGALSGSRTAGDRVGKVQPGHHDRSFIRTIRARG